MSTDVIERIRSNSWLFLQRAIKELISHDDSNDDGLSEERAVIATSLIQMSFELSLVAHFIASDGIKGVITDKDKHLPEAALIEKLKDNELATKPFNALKAEAIRDKIFRGDDDENLINEFQKIRNKLVHINYTFSKNELYDLKNDLTYFIVHVVMPTLSEERHNPSEIISIKIGSKSFKKLIRFPPYAKEMNRIAKQNSNNVYRCIHCGNNSLATDHSEEYCYSCCAELSHAGFIDCPYCKSERSMIYDALNISLQGDHTIKGLCLNCSSDDLVFLCEKCGVEIALEADGDEDKCHPGFCAVE